MEISYVIPSEDDFDNDLPKEKPSKGLKVYPRLMDEKVADDDAYKCLKDEDQCQFMREIRDYLWREPTLKLISECCGDPIYQNCQLLTQYFLSFSNIL